jgi:hypothetical protein
MKMWNEFDYQSQVEVMDIIDLLTRNKVPLHLRECLAAAISELEVWANTPCTVIEEDDTSH